MDQILFLHMAKGVCLSILFWQRFPWAHVCSLQPDPSTCASIFRLFCGTVYLTLNSSLLQTKLLSCCRAQNLGDRGLYILFLPALKNTVIPFSLSPSLRARRTGPDWGCTPSSASLSAFHFSPGLPSTGEENFSLLRVTSPSSACGSSKGVFRAGGHI